MSRGGANQQPHILSFNGGTGPLRHDGLEDCVEGSAAAGTLQNTLIQLLVGLTALESLTVDCYHTAPVFAGTTEASHLQCLTGLSYLCLPHRQFTNLNDEESEYWWPVHIYQNKAPEGSAPDVYQQLQLPVTPLYPSFPWRQAYKDAEREAQEFFKSLASDAQWHCEQLTQLFGHDFVLHGRFWGQSLSRKWNFGKGRSHLLCAGKASCWRGLQGVRFTTQWMHNELAQSYSRCCGSGAWLRRELSGDAMVRQLAVPDSSVVTDKSAVMYRKLRYYSVLFDI